LITVVSQRVLGTKLVAFRAVQKAAHVELKTLQVKFAKEGGGTKLSTLPGNVHKGTAAVVVRVAVEVTIPTVEVIVAVFVIMEVVCATVVVVVIIQVIVVVFGTVMVTVVAIA